jgi:hypothetical protein
VEKDMLGNEWWSDIKTLKVSDNVPPEVSVQGAPSGWQNTNAVAYTGCSDPGSGCDPSTFRFITYQSNPGSCPNDYNSYGTESPLSAGSHLWICGTAKDASGNAGYSQSVEFKIDKSAPLISMDINESDCTASPQVTLTLSYSDPESDIKDCRYANEGQFSAWEQCSTSKQWTLQPGTGQKIVTFHARDNAGNTAEYHAGTTLDNSPPEAPNFNIFLEWTNDTTPDISWSESADYGCGTAGYEYRIDQNPLWTDLHGMLTLSMQPLPEGPHHVYVRAYDSANNRGGQSEAVFNVDVTPPAISGYHLMVDKNILTGNATISPASTPGVADGMTMNVSSSEPVVCVISIGNMTWQSADYSPSCAFPDACLQWNGTAGPCSGEYLPDGNYQINTAIKDMAGNMIEDVSKWIKIEIHAHMMGDFNNDCEVDIFDLAAICLSFGSVPGDSNWKPTADFDKSGEIDIFDLVTVMLNFGRTC